MLGRAEASDDARASEEAHRGDLTWLPGLPGIVGGIVEASQPVQNRNFILPTADVLT